MKVYLKMECSKAVGINVKESEWEGMDTDANTILFLFCPHSLQEKQQIHSFFHL